MCYNHETNRFEKLSEVNEKEFREELDRMTRELKGQGLGEHALAENEIHIGLLRPDGTFVPKHWPIFKIDEIVEIKDVSFKVKYIGETALLLEPIKSDDMIIKGNTQ